MRRSIKFCPQSLVAILPPHIFSFPSFTTHSMLGRLGSLATASTTTTTTTLSFLAPAATLPSTATADLALLPFFVFRLLWPVSLPPPPRPYHLSPLAWPLRLAADGAVAAVLVQLVDEGEEEELEWLLLPHGPGHGAIVKQRRRMSRACVHGDGVQWDEEEEERRGRDVGATGDDIIAENE